MTLQKHVDIWDIKPTSKHQNMDIHDITKTCGHLRYQTTSIKTSKQ